MADRRGEFGRRGEDAACAYLLRHGYSIVERNYRCRRGEIDIIAAKDGGAVFVEVKTRRSLKFGTPGMAKVWHAGHGGNLCQAAENPHHGAVLFAAVRRRVQ